MKKRVAINTRFLLKDKMEGFGWYTYETISRLVIKHPEISFYFFFDRPYDEKFVFSENVTPIVLYPPARHPILFRIWFNFSVKRALKKYSIDLFISPDGYLSLTSDVKQIAVIHDLNFEHFPKDLPARDSRYLRNYFPKFAHKADHIITVSEFSKKDIIETYGIDSEKITVAYNGASDEFKPINEESEQKVRAKYTEGYPYFLFVGALHPRKNIKRLLEAFDLFKSEYASNTHLLIVGETYYWSEEMKKTLASMKNRKEVHFTGHVSLPNLVNLYGAAKALTFVAYFEGFGIPIVEAMKSGCPVLIAENTACHEVAGDAALVCDAFSTESIKQALSRLDSDSDLCQSLSESGIKRSDKFSWDSTAQKMSEIMTKFLK